MWMDPIFVSQVYWPSVLVISFPVRRLHIHKTLSTVNSSCKCHNIFFQITKNRSWILYINIWTDAPFIFYWEWLCWPCVSTWCKNRFSWKSNDSDADWVYSETESPPDGFLIIYLLPLFFFSFKNIWRPLLILFFFFSSPPPHMCLAIYIKNDKLLT
jgi:hypothetical protein